MRHLSGLIVPTSLAACSSVTEAHLVRDGDIATDIAPDSEAARFPDRGREPRSPAHVLRSLNVGHESATDTAPMSATGARSLRVKLRIRVAGHATVDLTGAPIFGVER